MTTPASSIYVGKVGHTRLRPFLHSFEYRVFYMLLDLDEIDSLDRRLRLFSRNRLNLFSFHDADHSSDEGEPPRVWIDRLLAEAGIDLEGGRVMLLSFPRIFGYVFNPISVWYCFDARGSLRAVLHEVRNTFGDRHGYFVDLGNGGDRGDVAPEAVDLRHEFAKELHVSPFMDMDSTYHFAIVPPAERISIGIRQTDGEGDLFRARLTGTREPLTDSGLWKVFWTHPLMTLKAIGAIHLQALRLWRRGARFHRRPVPPDTEVTFVVPHRQPS